MWTKPTTPNLTDYLSFLSNVVGIPGSNFPSVTGIATGGSQTTLTDSLAVWTINQWKGSIVNDSTQGVTASVLSNTSSILTFAALANPIAVGDTYLIAPQALLTTFNIAMATVNDTLACASADLYVLAVYNLATDRLINYAPDVGGQTFFQDQRTKFRVLDVSVGVPSAASDQGTAVGILNPEFMKTMTLQDLQTLKTPWGRAYMGIALDYGSNLWGLS